MRTSKQLVCNRGASERSGERKPGWPEIKNPSISEKPNAHETCCIFKHCDSPYKNVNRTNMCRILSKFCSHNLTGHLFHICWHSKKAYFHLLRVLLKAGSNSAFREWLRPPARHDEGLIRRGSAVRFRRSVTAASGDPFRGDSSEVSTPKNPNPHPQSAKAPFGNEMKIWSWIYPSSEKNQCKSSSFKSSRHGQSDSPDVLDSKNIPSPARLTRRRSADLAESSWLFGVFKAPVGAATAPPNISRLHRSLSSTCGTGGSFQISLADSEVQWACFQRKSRNQLNQLNQRDSSKCGCNKSRAPEDRPCSTVKSVPTPYDIENRKLFRTFPPFSATWWLNPRHESFHGPLDQFQYLCIVYSIKYIVYRI